MAETAWSTEVQTMTEAYRYLWNYEVVTYSDGSVSSTDPRVIGVYGETGADGTDGQMLYATCTTAAATAAKEANISAGTLTLSAGVSVAVKFSYANTAAAPTLNVAGTGAKNMYLGTANVSSSNTFYWTAGATVIFVYNGTTWVVADSGSYQTTTTLSTKIATLETTSDSIVARVSATEESITTLETDIAETNATTMSVLSEQIAEQIATVYGVITTVKETYVLTTDYESAISELQTQINQTSESVTVSVSSVQTQIDSTNEELEVISETIAKYFTFDTDGLTISDGNEGSMSLVLSNDQISFVKGGDTMAYWDGDYLYTGNIYVKVTEQARFGNFAWVPRSDGSLMLLKVGE